MLHVPPILAFMLGVATAAIAFTPALQVSTFRSLQGIDYSTTLTTSNLRTLVAKAYLWRADHDATARRQAARTGAVVAGFAVGAAVGALCTHICWAGLPLTPPRNPISAVPFTSPARHNAPR